MSRRIEFRAYGGTGSLVGRSFITLMALNAGDFEKGDVCDIFQMDYDDHAPIPGRENDGNYFKNMIADYEKLYERHLGFLAPVKIHRNPLSLKKIRANAYPDEEVYSLNSLYCSGRNREDIRSILSAAFTTDPSSTVEEIERSNANGCYGDLAVNGFISERLISESSFQKMNAYSELANNLTDAVVFYAGSTDGGTANTMIDKDIESMLLYLEASGKDISEKRQFKVYGLRTTPYSRFSTDKGGEVDRQITSDILKNKYAMSRGVFSNIKRQNDNASNDSVQKYSYYKAEPGMNYWLDGLFVGTSDKLDITADAAEKDNQFHPSHYVEFALAQEAMDALANRIPQNDASHLYVYNDGIDTSHPEKVTLEGFFGTNMVKYQYEMCKDAEGDGSGSVSLAKYIRAILLTLVTVRGRLIPDFKNPHAASYIQKGIFKSGEDDIDAVAPKVAEELESFLQESKFIVMTLVNVMDYSKFGGQGSAVDFVEGAIRFIYDYDNFHQQIVMPAGAGLSVAEDNMGKYTISLNQMPQFPLVDGIDDYNFAPSDTFTKGGKLKKMKFYVNGLQGATYEESGKNIANDILRRVFELYLQRL